MKLTTIGIGYLGLTHAVCMAELGHQVIGLDTDAEKVARAASGEAPFFEPGLEPLLRKNLDAGRLRFTTSFQELADWGEVHFVCVGTPQAADGSADLRQVRAAVDALSPHLRAACLVVGKSTVPVGTARALAARIRQGAPAATSAVVDRIPPRGLRGPGQPVAGPTVFGVISPGAADLLRRGLRHAAC